MSRARSLSPDENARVCDAVASLVEEYGSQAALAKELTMPDGSSVSPVQVSLAMRRAPIGVTFARAVATKLGLSLEELLSGAFGRTDGRQRYKELPGWEEAAKQVIDDELLPAFAVRAAGEGIVSYPVRRVDAVLVYDEGARWMKHAPVEVRRDAERAWTLAQRAEREAEDERRYAAMAHSDEVVRSSHVGEVPPPRVASHGR